MQTYRPLNFIPPEMTPWNLQLILPSPSEYGQFVLVSVEQASIETHHQVIVIDENNQPLRGVQVVFGFDSGPPINVPMRVNHWQDSPMVLRGNLQRTDGAGYAQHTFGEGGETVFIYDTDKNNDLLYPSLVIRNCTWVGTPTGRFIHTGVCLTFQLLRVGIVPLAEWLARMESDIAELKTHILTPLEPVKMAAPGNEWMTAIERRLSLLEAIVNAR